MAVRTGLWWGPLGAVKGGLALTGVGLMVACGAPRDAASPEPPPPREQSSRERGGARRLDSEVVPRRYTLALRLDPSAAEFTGEVTIDVELKSPRETLVLHGQNLTVTSAEVRRGQAEWRDVRVHAQPGAIELRLPETWARGELTLRLRYRAPLADAPHGLYRVTDAGRTYAFSQFEPIEARRAFPCFDEPAFKTPFRITLTVPEGNQALSNAREEAASTDAGWRTVRFAETKPLPTYLVAFAAGPLELLALPDGATPPVRAVATQDKAGLASASLKWTRQILAELERYFEQPYPFDKLDQVAVPNFAAGAMENVGLVTYREALLLVGSKPSAQERLSSQGVIAHELGHMWFGDLVTAPWWDDLWLNESFATWISPKMVSKVSPELGVEIGLVGDARRVMSLDSKAASRAVRQPVREQGDIYNAFDGITYVKGAALLAMIEAWVGAEPFRKGLQQYMRTHAYGSAATEDLLQSVEVASGKPAARVAHTFLDQPGTPLISAALECGANGEGTIQLAQSRYVPAGSALSRQGQWVAPVCLKYGDAAGRTREHCVLLERAEQSLPVEGACPVWIFPNAGARGYYRWALSEPLVRTLIAVGLPRLQLAERVALASDLGASFEAGRLSAELYLRSLEALLADPHPRVLAAVLDQLQRVGDALGERPLLASYAEWLRPLLEPALARLPKRRARLAAEGALVRPALLHALALWGQHGATRDKAATLAARYVRRPETVSSEDLAQWLPIAVLSGDTALWESLRGRLVAATSPTERRILVNALGHFGEPELVLRSLTLVLDGTLRGQDFRGLVQAMLPIPRRAAVAWLAEHYEALLQQLGEPSAVRLPELGSGLCDETDPGRLRRIFEALPQRPSGSDRNLALVIEEIELCATRQKALREGLGPGGFQRI